MAAAAWAWTATGGLVGPWVGVSVRVAAAAWAWTATEELVGPWVGVSMGSVVVTLGSFDSGKVGRETGTVAVGPRAWEEPSNHRGLTRSPPSNVCRLVVVGAPGTAVCSTWVVDHQQSQQQPMRSATPRRADGVADLIEGVDYQLQ